MHSEFLPGTERQKGIKQTKTKTKINEFTVEKSDKYYLSQVIKININSDKSC